MQNRTELLTLEYYIPYILDAVRILFIFVFAYLATLIAERFIRAVRKYSVRMMLKAGDTSEFEVEKRASTVSNVARKSIVILIWTVAIMMALQKLGFEIGPILASLGVVGVAVGFGAQSLVKDILAGLFLLVENQIRVNDIAVINGTGGLVEEINLRTTVLRGENGAVHIFSNGNIQTLSNLTRDYSYYVFELSVAYSADTDEVIAALRDLAETIANEEPYRDLVLSPLEIVGVDKLADSGVIFKARFKTLAGKQFIVGREMNRRIKKRFEQAGIEISHPTPTIHLRQDVSPEIRTELKQIVREVLNERRAT